MGLLPSSWFPRNERSDEFEELPVYDVLKLVGEPIIGGSFDVNTRGLDNVPEEGGAVLASNHASWLDPVFIGAVLDRPVHWMAKATLFRNPFLDDFFESAGQIKVDRVSGGNQAAVDRSVELAREGRIAGIFPEGSRSIDGSLRRGRTGVARVALRSGKPVLPVALTSYAVLPKHAAVPKLGDPLVVNIGEPRRYEGMEKRVEDADFCRKVTDEIMDEIGRLLEQARTTRDKIVYRSEGE